MKSRGREVIWFELMRSRGGGLVRDAHEESREEGESDLRRGELCQFAHEDSREYF